MSIFLTSDCRTLFKSAHQNKINPRFAQALVTKITNQIESISKIIEQGDYEFKHQDFNQTLLELKNSDFVYSDPTIHWSAR